MANELKEFKAKKEGFVTALQLADELAEVAKRGISEKIVIVYHDKDDKISVSATTMNAKEIIGQLECGKRLVFDDMYEYE